MEDQRNEKPSSDRLFRDYASANEQDLKATSSKADACFPERLHYMLSDMEKDGLQHIASWQPHGRCFVVRDQTLFTENVLP
jgi:hypothetical protein